MKNLTLRGILRSVVAVSMLIALFVLSFIGISIVFPLLRIMGLDNAETLQLLAVVAALLLVLATTMSWRSSKELNRTLIRPRIFVRGSTRAEREEEVLRGQLDETQVGLPGIRLENIGLGPAIGGDITLIEEDGNEIPIKEGKQLSFARIPSGHVYMYPSRFSPELAKHLRGKDGEPRRILRLKIKYFDLDDFPYELRREEQEVYLDVSETPLTPVIQRGIVGKFLSLLGELDSDSQKELMDMLTTRNLKKLIGFFRSLDSSGLSAISKTESEKESKSK